MPIILKTRREIELMRRAGHVAFLVIRRMIEAAAAGVTTAQLNEVARAELARHGAVGLSKNYPSYREGEGFPAETCISVNEEVVHGIPGPRVLREGDIMTVDLALRKEGYCCDTAWTIGIGKLAPACQRLVQVTRQALEIAVENVRPGRNWSDIARLMQHHVEQSGFSVVREFVGHGIGRSMHEEPKVPNFVVAGGMRGDFKLRAGMTLAVEPMVVMGRADVQMSSDQWTVVTADGQPAAHFEHTIAVTDQGAEVLTGGDNAAVSVP